MAAHNGILDDVGVRAHQRQQRGIGGWRHLIVGIDKREPFALRHTDGGIAGVAESAVRLVNHAEMTILRSPFVAQLRAAIWRAVIDQDDLVVGDILAYQALQATV